MRQWLPVVIRPHAQQENLHRALAAKTEPPQQIVGPEHVVTHYPRLARLYHRDSVLPQVALEAASRKQPRVLAACGNEHQRAGLAVSRPLCVHEHAHRDGVACGAFAVEQGKERA